MRRAGIALSAASLCALAACGSGTTHSTTATTAPESLVAPVAAPEPLKGSPVTDPAVLQAAMLSVGDLPDGFSVVPDPVRDLGLDPAPEYDSPDRSSTDPQVCANVLAPIGTQVAGATATAEVRYSGPEFSSLDEDAASYDAAVAVAAFAAVQDTFGTCTRYSGTDADGIAVDYTLGGREQDTVGDASTSVRLETTSEGYTLVSDVVVALVDHTLVQLVVTSQEGVDPASFTDLATTAVDRVRAGDRAR